MNTNNILKEINESGKPYVIYKTLKGFDLFTNFSKKIILNKKNIYNFINKKNFRKKYKSTDLFIGFFGYELLNSLIGVKISKQKNINFPKGIFYKPEKKISFTKDLSYKKDDNIKKKKNLQLILIKNLMEKFLINLKRKLKVVKLTKLKFAQNIKQDQI